MNPSTALATVVVHELIAGGVTDAVLTPGSRNAPLAMALHAADAAGRIRLHVRIDERTAGFLAVGLARGSGRPVPVATTSGTAVANLHPAVLEAHHGGVALVVLSADRPPWLRGVGANQVIDQVGVFGPQTLRFHHEFAVPARVPGQNGYWRSIVCRAVAAASGAGGRPGPVQLNIPLVEPLLPDPADRSGRGLPSGPYAVGGPDPADRSGRGSGPDEAAGDPAPDSDQPTALWPEPLAGRGGPWTRFGEPTEPGEQPRSNGVVEAPRPGERCLFVADLTNPLAAAVAAAEHPVIAEAGGLAGAGVIATGIHLLADAGFVRAHRPDRVVVLGRPTMFRSVTALLAAPGLAVEVVGDPDGYADVAGTARLVAPSLATIVEPAPRDWLEAWRTADTAARAAVEQVLAHRDIAASPALARTMSENLPSGATLVLGSSQMPRDIGRFALARDGVRIVANRGVAGIDGTVSTAVGVALSTAGPTYALMGDLTFLHDITGLAIGPHEPRPDLTIVVANNDGGGIFATLEPGAPAHAGAFERVFGTPVGAQLAPIVEGFGAEHLLAVTADELITAVAERPAGIRVVEVPVTRTDLRALLAEVREAVRGAVRGPLAGR